MFFSLFFKYFKMYLRLNDSENGSGPKCKNFLFNSNLLLKVKKYPNLLGSL